MAISSRPMGRSVLVTYGSETGNAQDFAHELGQLTQRLRFITRVCHLDAVELVCALHTSSGGGSNAKLSSRLYQLIL